MSRTGQGRRFRTAVFMGVCAAFVVTLQGCASMGSKDPEAQKKLVQERLDESLSAADKAQKQGQTDQALQLLEEATRIDPAAKQPWLRKAQIHFEARQYGPAITQAHEALQRDVNDLTAQSILAVSGLRVSASALDQLRKANEVTGSTRSEAESVARVIHQALGEPILLAPTAAGAAPAAEPAPRRGKAAARTAAPVARPSVAAAQGAAPAPAAAPAKPSAPALTPASSVSKPAPAARPAPAPAGRNNPFGALQ